jgi:hypothetical protein
MQVVLMIIAVWFTNGDHKSFALVAPSAEVCFVEKPVALKRFTDDPKVDGVTVGCLAVVVPKGTKA